MPFATAGAAQDANSQGYDAIAVPIPPQSFSFCLNTRQWFPCSRSYHREVIGGSVKEEGI
jgi:hypothetical protein